MQHEYRGHGVRMIDSGGWNALLTDLATGVLLPTKVTADRGETSEELTRRAHDLIDVYIEGRRRVTGGEITPRR